MPLARIPTYRLLAAWAIALALLAGASRADPPKQLHIVLGQSNAVGRSAYAYPPFPENDCFIPGLIPVYCMAPVVCGVDCLPMHPAYPSFDFRAEFAARLGIDYATDIEPIAKGWRPGAPAGEFVGLDTLALTYTFAIGPELSIAKYYIDEDGLEAGVDEIFFVKHAPVSTLHTDWNKATGGPQYFTALALAQDAIDDLLATYGAGNVEVAGVYWMQGESDGLCPPDLGTANAYEANLEAFCQNLRDDFFSYRAAEMAPSNNPKIILGRLSDNQFIVTHRAIIQAAQDAVAANNADVRIVNTDCLEMSRIGGTCWLLAGDDGLHFEVNGLVDLGTDMAASMRGLNPPPGDAAANAPIERLLYLEQGFKEGLDFCGHFIRVAMSKLRGGRDELAFGSTKYASLEHVVLDPDPDFNATGFDSSDTDIDGASHDVANVQWTLSTNRQYASQPAGTTSLAFTYLDGEVAGATDEGSIRVAARLGDGGEYHFLDTLVSTGDNVATLNGYVAASESVASQAQYVLATDIAAATPPLKLDGPQDAGAVGGEGNAALRVGGPDGSNLGGGNGSVAFGDIDGDGYDDLVMGAPNADRIGKPNAGMVLVVYGSASTSGNMDLSNWWNPFNETRILGQNANDQTGWSVACGDVDGDGRDDIVIGSPGDDHFGRSDAGAVHVVYGSPWLRGHTVFLSNLPILPRKTTIFGDDAGDRFGSAVATGDLDADGMDDVLALAPFADPLGRADAGEAYALLSMPWNAWWFVDLGNGSDASAAAGEARVFGLHAGQVGATEGGLTSVASGDLNGDGYDDMIVGAAIGSDVDDSGYAFAFFGGASLSGAIVDLLNPAPSDPTPAAAFAFGEASGDRFGASVASGDLNGDGYDDLLAGAPANNGGAGAAYALRGSAGMPGASASLGSNPANALAIRGDAGDGLGSSVAAGDPDGDALADFVAGGSAGNAASLFYGARLAASQGGYAEIDLASTVADATFDGASAGDGFGSGGAAMGDLNRDGYAEWAVSGPGGDLFSAGAGSGYVAVANGRGARWIAAQTRASVAGDAPAVDEGVAVRLSVDFSHGDAGWSLVERLPDANLATFPANMTPSGAMWALRTDRLGGYPANQTRADLVASYTDAEVAGLNENKLRLVSASSLSGPWTSLSNRSLDKDANKASGRVSDLSDEPTYVALVKFGF